MTTAPSPDHLSASRAAGDACRSLPPDPTAASLARRVVRETLAEHRRRDEAELLVSELVTNALTHAASEIELRVAVHLDAVRVEVTDRSRTLPVMRAPSLSNEDGRGMLLVQELADVWGAESHEGGKTVWFELHEPPVRGPEDTSELLADMFPRVLHDAPAAILLVDLGAGEVVYANVRARGMAPDTALPVATDAWSRAASLRDPAGQPLADTASPLSRLAAGVPIAGEPVTVDDGQGGRRLQWVTGFPLVGAAALQRRAIVVFFEMAGSGAAGHGGAAADALREMRDRAVVATDISFTISDPGEPDDPIVWANPAFTRMTGYDLDEVTGRNCRFLQGPGTDPRTVGEIRAALRERRPTTTTLLNYRKDGSAFWNELSLSPVFDGDGELIHFVGVQADVTARVHAEQQLEAAYQAERTARTQLALLAEVTTVLTETLDADEAITRLVDLVVPTLGGWCAVDLLEDDGTLRRTCAPGRPEGSRAVDLAVIRAGALGSSVLEVLDSGRSTLVPHLNTEAYGGVALDDGDVAMLTELSVSSALTVPLRARNRMLGVLTLGAIDGRRYDGDDLDLAQDLARRAALAVDNARLYTREHEVAEALQRSLLPSVPAVAGITTAVRYLPATVGAEVGGDWYDMITLSDGSVGLAIGDAMGHDLAAAAAMGQFRSVLRSYAWAGEGPAAVVARVDALLSGLGVSQLATLLYARLERVDGLRRLSYANAGHLPPLLLCPQRGTRFLDEGHSVLLGAAPEQERGEASLELLPGSTLLLYTDGLVERRDAHLDRGLERLARVAGDLDPGGDPEALCDRVLEELLGRRRDDDVALLAVRVET